MNISEEKAQLEARLALLARLENASKAVQEAKAAHTSRLESIATENGFKNWAELEAALNPPAPKPAAKRAQKKPAAAPKAAKAAPKGKRKRASITPETRAKIIEAYKNRGDKTVAEVAAQFGVSDQTVYKAVRK